MRAAVALLLVGLTLPGASCRGPGSSGDQAAALPPTVEMELARPAGEVYAAVMAELAALEAVWLERSDGEMRARAKVADSRVELTVDPVKRSAARVALTWLRYGIDQPAEAEALLQRAIGR